MDPPAPGACPLPRLPTSWFCPQPPLFPFNHPSISSASSQCWESLKQCGGWGGIHSCPLPPQTAGHGRLAGVRARETFQGGSKAARRIISVPKSQRPKLGTEDGMQNPLPPIPMPSGSGTQEGQRGREGEPRAPSSPAIPAPLPPGRPPGHAPTVPPAPRTDLSRHRTRCPDATCSPTLPPFPSHTPAPEDLEKTEGT